MNNSHLPLSICILCNRNDQRFLDCLSSTQFADEILIIDHNSTNNWKLLSAKYRFKVIEHFEPSIHQFSQVRNQALSAAKHDWVFFLDSDEVLVSDQQQIIAECIDTQSVSGYFVTRFDVFHNRVLKYGEGKMRIIRLVKKSVTTFTGSVHEKATVTGRVEYSDVHILHYSHLSISAFVEKVSWYAQLAAHDKPSSREKVFFEIITYPFCKFFYNFVVLLGFLDGWQGLVYSFLMSLHSLWVRVYRYEHLT